MDIQDGWWSTYNLAGDPLAVISADYLQKEIKNAAYLKITSEGKVVTYRKVGQPAVIARFVPPICEYSLAHMMDEIPAVTTIDAGPIGIVNACQKCADFYEQH